MRAATQLNVITIEEEQESSLEEEYGYDTLPQQDQKQVEHKDHYVLHSSSNNLYNSRNSPECNFIMPVPTQTLTVQDASNLNVHLDLDTGATVSYAKLKSVLSHGFKIRPNNQLSNLADGRTKMAAVGEIDEIFTRNNWQVRFQAIVTKDLHCDFVAGNNFIKHNGIIQDINNKTIKVHNKYTVAETNKLLIMPTTPHNHLIQNNHVNVLLPGQHLMCSVPHHEATVVSVEPWFQNKNTSWPMPQLCTVSNGHINLVNNLSTPLHISKEVPQLQIRSTKEQSQQDLNVPQAVIHITPKTAHIAKLEEINVNSANIDPAVIDKIQHIHENYSDVFNQDLSQGYNMTYGKHICKLNWASSTRPLANKVHTVNYDHSTKCLLQQVCDEYTQQGVLGIPQDHDVQIQHVSPAFLVRKQKAKNKPKHLLTPNDVRLVVNFGQLNDHLINMPTPITKPKHIFSQLGKWNYIITTDLYSGFFQNHMALEDAPWLGISTPFGGLRFLRRSGQGLIGQSEELDELLSKIIGSDIQDGHAARIADDLYIGGKTPEETADNYAKIMHKLSNANIKISPAKTHIFLPSVDILGWVWQQGGFLSPSPHRTNALKNTTIKDIKNVKDLRSWLGLYKTLLPASPNLTTILDPFDQVVADRLSNELVVWDRELEISFQSALQAIDNIQTLYLPHPEDQLLIVVDAAKANPGLGHTLYAIKNNKKVPVSFHSVKLQKPYSNWLPCELEALAFATAITAEYDVLKESKHPIIISPDSKSVADAVKLIRKGKFSTNPRIQSLITNVNRIPIQIQMAGGKANLNQCGDFQSRHPSTCQTEHCSICSFVLEASSSTLDPFSLNAIGPTGSHTSILQNRAAWIKIQDDDKACHEAKYLLHSGKTPSKKSGKSRLCSIAQIGKDNLLIVPAKGNKFSSLQKELTVIPSNHLPAVLWQIHNLLQHPTKNQLKAQFDKNFYSVGLSLQLDLIYDNCYYCMAQKTIPSIVPHYTMTDVTVPGTHFHADVIKRQSQNILVVRDHCSSFTAAKIIKSESHNEFKSALIDILTPIKLVGTTQVKVDNATGFKPLLDNKDQDLNKLNISLTAIDVFNKNENAVVDKACQELEKELKRIEPNGRPISSATL